MGGWWKKPTLLLSEDSHLTLCSRKAPGSDLWIGLAEVCTHGFNNFFGAGWLGPEGVAWLGGSLEDIHLSNSQISACLPVRGLNQTRQRGYDCPKFLFFFSITRAMKHSGLNAKPAAFLKRQSISPLTRGKEIIITWLVASVRWKTAVAGKAVRMSCINYLTLAGKIILSVIWPLVSCSFW